MRLAWLIFLTLPDALPDCLPDCLPPPRAVATVTVTAEVAQAIDQRFLERWHWKLSPGTCGMLGCVQHGGGWIKAAGEAPKESEAQPTRIEYRRAGLFGRRRVAVEVEDGTGARNGTPNPPSSVGDQPLQSPVQSRTTGTVGSPDAVGASPTCPNCPPGHG